MTYNLPDIYKEHYVAELGGALKYNLYRDIVYDFNRLVMKSIIEDAAMFFMGNGLGPILINRVRRRFGRKSQRAINWPVSLKKKQKLIDEGKVPYSKESAPHGEPWYVYFMTDFIVRFRWNKWRCSVKNHPLYAFTPTRGAQGNKDALKKFLKADERNIMRYPIVERKKK